MTRFTGGFPPDPDAPAPLLPAPAAAGADAGPGLPIPAADGAPAPSSPPSPEDSIPGDRNPRFADPAASSQPDTNANTRSTKQQANLTTRACDLLLRDKYTNSSGGGERGRGEARPMRRGSIRAANSTRNNNTEDGTNAKNSIGGRAAAQKRIAIETGRRSNRGGHRCNSSACCSARIGQGLDRFHANKNLFDLMPPTFIIAFAAAAAPSCRWWRLMLFRLPAAVILFLSRLDAAGVVRQGQAAKERRGEAMMWICSWSGVDFVRARCESRGGVAVRSRDERDRRTGRGSSVAAGECLWAGVWGPLDGRASRTKGARAVNGSAADVPRVWPTTVVRGTQVAVGVGFS